MPSFKALEKPTSRPKRAKNVPNARGPSRTTKQPNEDEDNDESYELDPKFAFQVDAFVDFGHLDDRRLRDAGVSLAERYPDHNRVRFERG
jgi:hypothetical protein